MHSTFQSVSKLVVATISVINLLGRPLSSSMVGIDPHVALILTRLDGTELVVLTGLVSI